MSQPVETVRGPWWWRLFNPHRKTLALGFLATVVCSTAASFVPYFSGRAVHALELSQWNASRTKIGRAHV